MATAPRLNRYALVLGAGRRTYKEVLVLCRVSQDYYVMLDAGLNLFADELKVPPLAEFHVLPSDRSRPPALRGQQPLVDVAHTR